MTAPETERLICVTSAGREGKHIFRLTHEHARCEGRSRGCGNSA